MREDNLPIILNFNCSFIVEGSCYSIKFTQLLVHSYGGIRTYRSTVCNEFTCFVIKNIYDIIAETLRSKQRLEANEIKVLRTILDKKKYIE